MTLKTRDLQKKDKKFIWHPFTQMKEWDENDILIFEKGKGCYLQDTNGKWYLDAISSLWVTVHGHNNSFINRAVKKQLYKLSHSTLLGFANVPSIKLAEELIKISPKGLEKVFYSDSGSTSVEIALKMAYQYWFNKGEKRPFFIKFQNTYHGDTLGSVSVGGMSLFHDIYKPLLFKTFEVPWPATYLKPSNISDKEWQNHSLKEIEKILKKNKNKVSALITEPLIQGAFGMSTAPIGFLKDVESICRKYDILLIVDEVATGFGRTGKMFACEWEDVKPDIMCAAKGLTGGYLPLAVTLVKNKIYDAFLYDYKELKTFFHGHTYTGNQLGCAAALANLELFKKDKTLYHLQKKIEVLKNELSFLTELKHVGDIRQKGFMAGIELVLDKEKKLPFSFDKKIAIKVCRRARDKGVILRPLGNVIVILPPLSIKLKDVKMLVKVIKECIKEITEKK